VRRVGRAPEQPAADAAEADPPIGFDGWLERTEGLVGKGRVLFRDKGIRDSRGEHECCDDCGDDGSTC
jgi:hypothetical protein